MIFSIITFIVAITIAIIAGWFSIAGLMAIFSASAVAVAIMAGALEIGKLVSASWVYRNWNRAPFLLKAYLTAATVVLMFITSMGIFGFLSRAHLEQSAMGEQNVARIERIETDINRSELTITRLENDIASLDTEVASGTSNIQAQIDAEQVRMDNAYARIQPAIGEQNAIIEREQSGSQDEIDTYLNRISEIDQTLREIQDYVANDDIRSLQALVGVRVDGRYGSGTAEKVDAYRNARTSEKERLASQITSLRESVDQTVIDVAREEIKRLRDIAEREVQTSQSTIERLRLQLQQSAEVDNATGIDELRVEVSSIRDEIEIMLDEKFVIETEVRKLEAEVGPIKYIAELVYGNTDRSTIDDAVRWLIIVFIFVFDPLAVLLLIAANYSFVHRDDHENRQDEIFETLFSKKKKTAHKVLDNDEEISDNEVIKEEIPSDEMINNITSTEIKRNTTLVKRAGWLDDITK